MKDSVCENCGHEKEKHDSSGSCHFGPPEQFDMCRCMRFRPQEPRLLTEEE